MTPPQVAPTNNPRDIPPETELVASLAGGGVEKPIVFIVSPGAVDVLAINSQYATDDTSFLRSVVEFCDGAKY
jgi:hypothetical protein